jgi:predicted PurR-regulated permease PerM
VSYPGTLESVNFRCERKRCQIPVVGPRARHHSNIERALGEMEQAAPRAFAGILVIPILAIFFLSDGEKPADQTIRLVATKDNHADLQSLAGELHAMLQRYIRAKVILGGLSLLYCSLAMLLLGFPNAIALGILAGILEFIPVAGWMTAAATIAVAGVLTDSHWIWMLALLAVWRMSMDYGISPRVMGLSEKVFQLLVVSAYVWFFGVDRNSRYGSSLR